MSDREAMKLALEALEWAWGGEPMGTKEQAAMQALRTALAAEPTKQEPVRCNPAAMRTTASSPAVLFITELDPPALAAPRPEPVATVGTQSNDFWKGFNGKWVPPAEPTKMVHLLRDLPVGTLLYTAPPAAAPPEDEALRRDAERLTADNEALRQELAAVLSDWNSLVRASGSSTNGGAVGHVAALRREAERYRWIRDNHEIKGRAMEIVYNSNGKEWDADIDWAMREDKT
jgi:hypothetical protein